MRVGLLIVGGIGLLCLSSPSLAQVAALLSRNSFQEPADSHSYRPSLSSDGRYVAFDSWAGNLASGVDVANSGVFVRDVLRGTTVLAITAGGDVPDGEELHGGHRWRRWLRGLLLSTTRR